MTKINIISIILILIALLLGGCNLQRNMLYYPSKDLPSPAFLSAYNIAYWPNEVTDYRGFISTLPVGAVKGTIIVFHGNAGTAADRIFYLKPLTQLGYRVILAEYPGYGGRSGELGEGPFVLDARESLRLAHEKYGAPLFLLGESLGCGIAAAAVKDSAVKIDGLILITPWDTLLSVAREKLPWFPVRLFLRDSYDSIGNVIKYQGPIAVIGAERDEVIPIAHAQALFRSLPGSPKLYIIKGAGHNDWPGMVDLAWWREVTGFIQGNVR